MSYIKIVKHFNSFLVLMCNHFLNFLLSLTQVALVMLAVVVLADAYPAENPRLVVSNGQMEGINSLKYIELNIWSLVL
jgi:hypothetical protein